ncbi:Lipase, partial [Cucurbita argyrosperma subsp. argyrosperma]
MEWIEGIRNTVGKIGRVTKLPEIWDTTIPNPHLLPARCGPDEDVCGARARELFYYLKGGRVDYGEEHSKAYGHSQFGRVYELGQKMGDQKPCPALLVVLQMSQWRHPSDVATPYKGYRDEDWQDNDGALNTISMTHPRFPVEHPNRHVVDESDCKPLEPGIWYYKVIEGDHIMFIVNRERAGVQFDLIYDAIFERCRKHVFRKNPPTLPNQPHP